MSQFILCSVNVNGTAVSTLASNSYSAGVERLLVGAAGNHQADFAALIRQVPRVAFSTRKIDAFSAVALGSGNAIFRVVANGGTGGSTYISMTGTNGAVLCVPRSISWTAGSAAVLNGEMIFLSTNGTTAPVTVGSTAGSTTAETKIWTGDVSQVYSINIDFGFDIALPQDGLLYQQNAFVVSQRPVITIGTYDGDQITTTNANPGSISTLTATLAEQAEGGVRGTQKSYAVTGHLIADSIAGAKPGTVSLRCDGRGGLTIS